eukprot:CAMPEP_0118942738 /NCGR_PEP_ID=MMETSP1169-20130426/36751_1 /TAXON_ID=36882 /ORGANISM="Pyramimonas obovata, Strain CCMP722" /LENGTH=78 /DNA_ID=CAMNT_0006887803 /DNA_START=1251 /DNA_END=1487 /DNA_ORIENTATION=-
MAQICLPSGRLHESPRLCALNHPVDVLRMSQIYFLKPRPLSRGSVCDTKNDCESTAEAPDFRKGDIPQQTPYRRCTAR